MGRNSRHFLRLHRPTSQHPSVVFKTSKFWRSVLYTSISSYEKRTLMTNFVRHLNTSRVSDKFSKKFFLLNHLSLGDRGGNVTFLVIRHMSFPSRWYYERDRVSGGILLTIPHEVFDGPATKPILDGIWSLRKRFVNTYWTSYNLVTHWNTKSKRKKWGNNRSQYTSQPSWDTYLSIFLFKVLTRKLPKNNQKPKNTYF